MAASVTVNGKTVVHAASEGVSTAFPDACRMADGTVIPCFNTAFSKDITNCAATVFADGHPVATSASYIATSTGNEHTLGGVISGEVKGKASFINYSMNVFIEGKPVPRNGDPMVHNHGSPFNAMSPAIVQPNIAGANEKELLCEVYCFCKDKGKTECADRSIAEPRYVRSPKVPGTRSFPFPLRYWDPRHPKFYVEVPFDMTAPGGPAPMMDPTQRMSNPPHHPLPQAARWGLKARRPDGVIVHNPALPLTRQNIKQIFEFKFPGDRWRKDGQLQAYTDIDPRGKPLVLDEETCGASCLREDDGNPKLVPVHQEQEEPLRHMPPEFAPMGRRANVTGRPVPIGPLVPVLSLAGLLALLARFGSVLNPAFMVPIMPGGFSNPNAGKET